MKVKEEMNKMFKIVTQDKRVSKQGAGRKNKFCKTPEIRRWRRGSVGGQLLAWPGVQEWGV